MPTWGEILEELNESAQSRGGNPDFDGVRRKYLAELHALTGRNIILYSTDFVGGGTPKSGIMLEDMQGMMEVCRLLDGPDLDIILHSPGGSAEATASIVRYLRQKFDDIRVFVPLAAMSAATMWALASNRIVMGKHSQLGPIDPQLVTTSGGVLPARGIIDQFERARREVKDDPAVLGAWLPILQQYGPSLLDQCEKAEALARRLVAEWLAEYMLGGQQDAAQKASDTAKFFADRGKHQSHDLGISRDQARAEGLVIENLEDDGTLQDAVLSVHHAALHTLEGPAVKIVENHLGKGFFVVGQTVSIPAAPPAAPPPPAPPATQNP